MSIFDKLGVSIIVPFYNEEDGIELFCKKIDEYASTLEFELELIFVDDGSNDKTEELLRKFEFLTIKEVTILKLSKNFGSHAAIRAGITKSKKEICTWMGCDLQEPFDILPLSYQKITKENFDAVYIEKNTIKISIHERFFSKVYSAMMRKYAVRNYSSGGVSTIVFNKKIIDYLNKNIESNSSIMLQIMDAGFSSCSFSMNFGERYIGKSKWTLAKKIKLFIDSFVAFSFAPIRLVSIIGVLIFVLGMVIGIITIINRFINPEVPIGYSTLTSIMAMGFGVTNISLGIIAEYLWRTYDAARNRPAFIISEIKVLKCDESKNTDI